MRLIADIGGTNARFALAGPEGIAEVVKLPVAAYPNFDDALETYLAARPDAPISSVAMAAAGPSEGNSVRLTNAPWTIDAAAVSRRFGGVPARVMNDLAAVALGLPTLGSADTETLAAGAVTGRPSPMLAANVGTGFGAAVAVPERGRWSALATEAGHMSLIAGSAAEAALFGGARSVEDAFSGPGYARLLGGTAQEGGESVSPAAETGDGDRARHVYSRVFGRVLGDLALATGAWGGVYLTGGVISAMHRIFDVDQVLEAFRNKGKMTPRMSRIPILRITLGNPAFRSLASAEID